MRQLIWLILIICSSLPAIAQGEGESGLLLGSQITYTGVSCTASATGRVASCALSASGAVGDLLVVASKSSSTTSAVGAALSFSGTASCASPAAVISPSSSTWENVGTQFITAMHACVITTAGATTPVITWTGTTGANTVIQVATYHTVSSWRTSFVDQTISNVTTSTLTNCSTGTTGTTTNANDLIVVVCGVGGSGVTWSTPNDSFTNRATSSSANLGWYDKISSNTAAQTAAISLSGAAGSVGMIAAFASN